MSKVFGGKSSIDKMLFNVNPVCIDDDYDCMGT